MFDLLQRTVLYVLYVVFGILCNYKQSRDVFSEESREAKNVDEKIIGNTKKKAKKVKICKTEQSTMRMEWNKQTNYHTIRSQLYLKMADT